MYRDWFYLILWFKIRNHKCTMYKVLPDQSAVQVHWTLDLIHPCARPGPQAVASCQSLACIPCSCHGQHCWPCEDMIETKHYIIVILCETILYHICAKSAIIFTFLHNNTNDVKNYTICTNIEQNTSLNVLFSLISVYKQTTVIRYNQYYIFQYNSKPKLSEHGIFTDQAHIALFAML